MGEIVVVDNSLSGNKNSAKHSRCGFQIVGSCQVLRQVLDRSPSVTLIITETTLPDGNWCTILRELVVRCSSAKLVVCSRRPNEVLRREALQRGASYAVGNPEIVAATLHIPSYIQGAG